MIENSPYLGLDIENKEIIAFLILYAKCSKFWFYTHAPFFTNEIWIEYSFNDWKTTLTHKLNLSKNKKLNFIKGTKFSATIKIKNKKQLSYRFLFFSPTSKKPFIMDNSGENFFTVLPEVIYKKHEQPYRTIAEMLRRGKIVGVCFDRAESVNRGLGHRSILIDPRNNRFNHFIKIHGLKNVFKSISNGGLSILAGKFHLYFDGKFPSFKMENICELKKEQKKYVLNFINENRFPVQTVDFCSDKFSLVLEEFEKLTGHPLLINLPLSINGTGIAQTWFEAIIYFFNSYLDAIFFNDYMIQKEMR